MFAACVWNAEVEVLGGCSGLRGGFGELVLMVSWRPFSSGSESV